MKDILCVNTVLAEKSNYAGFCLYCETGAEISISSSATVING